MRVLRVIASVLLLASFVSGQTEWETKAFDVWDKDDVNEILSDSDWAKTFTKQWNIGTLIASDFTAVVLLRSALPIRMALLRKLQLENGYRELKQKDKKDFDGKNAAIYTCPACKTHFIVSVFSKEISLAREMTESKKKYVTLADDQGREIKCAGFSVRRHSDQAEYIFFFPRADSPDGFLGPDAASVTFKLDFRVDDLRGLPFRKATFDKESISRDGILVF